MDKWVKCVKLIILVEWVNLVKLFKWVKLLEIDNANIFRKIAPTAKQSAGL